VAKDEALLNNIGMVRLSAFNIDETVLLGHDKQKIGRIIIEVGDIAG